jgi:hypothetical protein
LLQLEDGHPQALCVFLDLYHPFGMGWIDNAFVKDLFDGFVGMVRKTAVPMWPLGQFRTTTIHPMRGRPVPPNYQLREGEFVHVDFVPSLLAMGASGGGVTLKGYEDNRSLYDPMKVYVCLADRLPPNMARALGQIAFHEVGHWALPRSGPFGNQSLHTADPANFLHGPPYGSQLPADPQVSDVQVKALDWNLTRCRINGLRANPAGNLLPDVRVIDGGRAAWPMKELS